MDASDIPRQDTQRLVGQIRRREIRVGPDAAREIAARIEASGGFWDYAQKRMDTLIATMQAEPTVAPSDIKMAA